MFDWIRTHVLRVMRVPHEPAPPFGAPGSIRIFRAGRNYFNLRLLRWGIGQAGALVGLCFSLLFFSWFRETVEMARLVDAQKARIAREPVPPVATGAAAPAKSARPKPGPRQVNPADAFREAARRTPSWGLVILEIIEAGGILIYLVQIPVSLALVRLEYELHWYIVTDRSLRIRTGVLRLQETTMSFANLQQVEVKQGPIQRLLGLADVRVQSAGGGSAGPQAQALDPLHTGVFHSVDNATEIRDLILERLRLFRQAGLGDHDDHHEPAAGGAVPSLVAPGADVAALAAAGEILAEVRALRQALARI